MPSYRITRTSLQVNCRTCGTPFPIPRCRERTAKYCTPHCRVEAMRVVLAVPRLPLAERFWGRVDRSGGPDACWEWTKGRHRQGYGKIKVDRRHLFAHRVAWELTHGTIPDGLLVLHKCDNPPCCNPAHLFLGTHQDNSDDMIAKGRKPPSTPPHRRGEDSNGARLTWDDVRAIRAQYVPYRTTAERLAARYGVGTSTVKRILRGDTWQE